MPEHSQPLDLAEALTALTALLPGPEPAEQEVVRIQQARGRILAQTVEAPVSLPPFPASAMDGYAIAADADLSAPFIVIGESFAGHPFTAPIAGNQCARVFTGAQVPPGSARVMLQENASSTGDGQVRFDAGNGTDRFIRPVGHDVSAGACLAEAGEQISPYLQGSLAAAGVAKLPVHRLPRVGVFSTGDELVDPATPPEALEPGQIYDSNRLTVLSLLADAPCELLDLGCVPDDRARTLDALQTGAARCDVLITSGGVSVGDADYVTAALETLGTLQFWKLNLKPGKPLAFGQIGACQLFGLPGNPVSTLVTLLLIAKPAIFHRAGHALPPPIRLPARLADGVQHSPGRAEYQRGSYRADADGLIVTHTGDQSSNRLRSFAGANCLIEIPKDSADLPPGAPVAVIPFNAL